MALVDTVYLRTWTLGDVCLSLSECIYIYTYVDIYTCTYSLSTGSYVEESPSKSFYSPTFQRPVAD